MKKFYTVYKITNLINGKIYFGQHITKDLLDDYMGSGTDLKYDIEKYGIENFKKEIIDVFNNFKDMDDLERLLISENIEDSYNGNVYGSGVKSIQLPSELKDKFDNFHNSLTIEELERFTLYHEKYLYNKYLKKVKRSNNILLDRKVGFSNLCKEYMEIKSQLEIPDMTINHNELNNRLLEIRQMSDFLNECLDYVTLDIMKTYSFNQQALKVIVDIKKLKLKAKDYGFIPDALIPYTDIPVILQKMYDDNNINKKPKRTVLMDWFDINEKVMINKVRYYKILGIKN